MNKDDYAKLWAQLARDGKLLTIKHNPANLANPENKDRSVVAGELAPVLPDFFDSQEFSLIRYDNTDYPLTPDYFVIQPTTPKFSVPASGVPAFSTTPTGQCDRLIIVSGQNQGCHIYGESSTKIQRRVVNGKLINQFPIV
jgi:hypothetical protein